MFDAHCDTLIKIYRNGGNLHKNDYDVSFEKLLAHKRAVQVFAVFNNNTLTAGDIIGIIKNLKKETASSGVASFCVTGYDIENNPKPISAMVSIESVGNTPDLRLEDITSFYNEGVRIMSLTWNHDTPLCGGIEKNRTGITPFGRDVLERMHTLGMVLDVSHVSDCGFYDAAEWGVKMIATHSNSRTVCAHNRNLTDEQFRILVSKGGVVGINTYPLFINGKDSANVWELIRHIEHFCSLGGEKNIGLGSDFDGIDHKMSDIDSCDKMQVLINELAKLNYKDEVIEGIYHKNFTKFMKNEILPD